MNLALFGNPNTGKTSLFNIMTGSYEYVGNWSGVTVEKKVGTLKEDLGQLIDLPGVYSVNPLSKDEAVATEFLLYESFQGIINIVDASQLERNLYLTVQLLEYGKPMILALNMMDVAKARGIEIDYHILQEQLQIPIVPVVARRGMGREQLLAEMKTLADKASPVFHIDYGNNLEEALLKVQALLPKEVTLPQRWLALQFLEGNEAVLQFLARTVDGQQLLAIKREVEEKLKSQGLAPSLQHYIRQVRSEFITNMLETCVKKEKEQEHLSDRIDAVIANKYTGIPVFLFLMFIIFKLTFDWLGTPLSDQLDSFLTGPLANWLQMLLDRASASPFMQAVVLNGIVAGVGGVLVFVPQIFILFFFISFIEDSGYMARVAMIMDRMMEKMGLNGKSFIPMIIGFGCNVPGVMAARTIEQPRERLLTILLIPLMSCSARLPVYSLFAGAFFAERQAWVVLALYVLGIIVSLLLAKVFSSTILKQEDSLFFVELPPYRFPQWRTLLRSTWEKGKGFVRKAGTVIFGGSVAIWFLSYAGPSGYGVKMNESFLAYIGGVIAPWLTPLGFGNWQSGAALLTGFFAKEVVVSTMNIIYASPDLSTLQGMMAQHFTPLQSLSFMAFVLLYVPCLATVGVIRKETGSMKWTWVSIFYALSIAYVIGLVIYQGGRLLGYQ